MILRPLKYFLFGLLIQFLALNELYCQQPIQANYKIDSLIQLSKSASNDSVRILSLIEISSLYSNIDIKKSILYAEEALSDARLTNNKELIQKAVFNAGNSCFYHGMYDRASAYFYEYLEVQKRNENEQGIAWAFANIGAIRLKMEDLNYAKLNFLEALKLLEPLKNSMDVKSRLPNIYNNLGIVYQNQKVYDSSLWYYKKALNHFEFVDNSETFQSAIYNNIGKLYQDVEKPDSAYYALKKAMDIRILSNDLAGQAMSHGNLGDFFNNEGLRERAKEHYYSGLKIALQIGSTDMDLRFSEKLYIYFRETNDADSALKYFEKFVAAKDEINKSETFKELTKLELTYQFTEKEKLEKLKQKKIQDAYLFASIILVLLLLISILLYYLKNNRLKRVSLENNNFKLQAQNANLQKDNLEKELEIRNKELTTHVMGMIRKNETVRELAEILSNNLPMENDEVYQKIIRDLNLLQDDHVWDEFEIRYQQVHNQFYDKLQNLFPGLTTNERRLCAFLRLNMTTKDIASVTGQSLRSIEVARTRLRKKLLITNSEISLIEFLNSL